MRWKLAQPHRHNRGRPDQLGVDGRGHRHNQRSIESQQGGDQLGLDRASHLRARAARVR
ncbi:MAG: hypothetical protein ABSG43_28215 [Solirubrobacteraceae bacterium]|jgi:hypothetical protein